MPPCSEEVHESGMVVVGRNHAYIKVGKKILLADPRLDSDNDQHYAMRAAAVSYLGCLPEN